ncbi:hypothetical protein HY992_03995 [Candidatus Micrarchaeota archaeon]|nr:hypothetical protein [Candidatus Micrarchaeota archaeon]
MKLFLAAFLLLLGASVAFSFFVNESNSSVRAERIQPVVIEEKQVQASASEASYPLLASAKLESLQPLIEKIEPFKQFVDYAIVGLVALVFLTVAYKATR